MTRLVLCARADHEPSVPYTRAVPCVDCGVDVWQSPSTRSLQQRTLLEPLLCLCVRCFRKRSKLERIEEICIAQEQRAEIIAATGVTTPIEELFAALGIKVRVI